MEPLDKFGTLLHDLHDQGTSPGDPVGFGIGSGVVSNDPARSKGDPVEPGASPDEPGGLPEDQACLGLTVRPHLVQ